MSQIIITRGDTAQAFTDTPTLDGKTLDTLGKTIQAVELRMRNKATGSVVKRAATVAAGKFTYQPISADVATAGNYELSWTVTFTDGTTITAPNDRRIDLTIIPDIP
jgi:hypothetical protein